MVAVARCGDEAYGMTVRREIQARTARDVSIGAVYATLDRLEGKGWVSSRYADAMDGGSGTRRYFTLAPDGVRALIEVRRLRERLWDGVKPEGLLPDG